MPVKKFKPTTPGRRGASVDAFEDITKSYPEKSLTVPLKKQAGRNNQGKISVRHKGGGHKRKYRLIDFVGGPLGVKGKIVSIEYDPNRTGRILLVEYAQGKRSYVLAPEGMKVGQTIITTLEKADIKPGNRMPLKNIPTGIAVHNIELVKGKGGEIVRSAGMSATIMSHEGGFTQLKMPSGEIRQVYDTCMATVGVVSNADHRNVRLGKAGRMRHRGVRPRVRGKAMNPVDHPHGGGEGNQPIGLKHPKTPWGKPAFGVKTRRSHRRSNRFIIRSRKTKNR